MSKRKRPKVTQRCMAGPDHAVLKLEGSPIDIYRRSPCPTCPWRVDAVGIFPAEAFKHSANVAYDCSMSLFSCHESGTKAPATCAGFLLRNAVHNLAVRMKLMRGLLDYEQIHDGGAALFDSYRAMSIANGVDPADPALARCRADNGGPR